MSLGTLRAKADVFTSAPWAQGVASGTALGPLPCSALFVLYVAWALQRHTSYRTVRLGFPQITRGPSTPSQGLLGEASPKRPS